MRVATLISSALTLAFFASFPANSQSKCRAIDGDTVRCGNERIRLRQVYAAEKYDAGGAQARANLQRQLDSGQIRIERKGKDKYGRTLGDIYVDGRKIGQSDVGTKGGRGLGSTPTGKSAAPRTKAQTRAPARSPVVAKPHSTAPKSSIGAGRDSSNRAGSSSSGSRSAAAKSTGSRNFSSSTAGSNSRAASSGRVSSHSRSYSTGRSSAGSRSYSSGSRSGGSHGSSGGGRR